MANVWAKLLRSADLERKLTKTFTASAFLQLRDEGKVTRLVGLGWSAREVPD